MAFLKVGVTKYRACQQNHGGSRSPGPPQSFHPYLRQAARTPTDKSVWGINEYSYLCFKTQKPLSILRTLEVVPHPSTNAKFPTFVDPTLFRRFRLFLTCSKSIQDGPGWFQDCPEPFNKSKAKDSQASKGPLSGKPGTVRQARVDNF